MFLNTIYAQFLAEFTAPIDILVRTVDFLRFKNQKSPREISEYETDKYERLQRIFTKLIDNTSWEELYEGECFEFKIGLKNQANILRNDPKKQGNERIKSVHKALLELSKQIALIGQVAIAMAEETPDCDLVRKLPREWLFSQTGEAEVEQVSVLMEYALDSLAFEVKADPSLAVKAAEHLEQIIKDIDEDFLP